MDPNTALQNVTAVCRAYTGTADEHDILKQSLEIIQQCIAQVWTAAQETPVVDTKPKG